MPRRELKHGRQVADWLLTLSENVKTPGNIILIGSGALLWHAHDRGIRAELPEASMDVDPVTDSDEIARFCYDCVIGSEFEREHGWHVNLMPDSVLNELPGGWRERAIIREYGLMKVIVPQPDDLLAPKLKRGEPRDLKHFEWAKAVGLVAGR
jgi:hypothetical protein